VTLPGRRRVRALVLAAIFLLAASPSPAAPPDGALRILFIGNSLTYFNDLPGMVAALAAGAGKPTPFCRSAVHGGYSLEDHWVQGDALRAIESGRWDFVVLQQGPSSEEDGRDVLRRFARRFAPSIRKSGATAALYMVWPGVTQPRSFGAVSDTYRIAARDVGGIFIPAGDAWRIALAKAPGIPLYLPDGFHPTPAGSYLAALVFAGTLYGVSPIGLPPLETSPEQAKILQEAAAEAIAASGGH
jgi:hypothetical protein